MKSDKFDGFDESESIFLYQSAKSMVIFKKAIGGINEKI